MVLRAGDHGARDACAPLPVRVLDWVVRLGGILSTVLILAAFGLTLVSVFMRYVMNAPLQGSDDITGLMLVTLVMLGACEAYRRERHIAIDLITGSLPLWARRWQHTFADLCVLLFAVLLGQSTWGSLAFARSFGAFTSGTIEIPLWIAEAPILVGAVLLGLIAFSRILNRHFGTHQP